MKEFIIERNGGVDTLHATDENKAKVYADLDTATLDIDNIEENEIVYTPDEGEADISEDIEKLVNNAGTPAGTICDIEIDDPQDLVGWLPCNGSTFDTERYPFLYAALGSNTLPFKLRKQEPVLNEEIMTGDMFNGKPVYAYRFKDAVARAASSWIALPVNGDNYFPYTQDIKEIVKGEVVSSYNATYRNGEIDASMFQITNLTAEGIVQSNSQLLYYSVYAAYNSANDVKTITLYYTKNNDNFTGTKYRFIRSLSGTETTAESMDVVNAVTTLRNKIAYCALPLGSTLKVENNSFVPDGFLLADGRDTTGTADELSTNYPMLYNYLGATNVLPFIADPGKPSGLCPITGVGPVPFALTTTDAICPYDGIIYLGAAARTITVNGNVRSVFDTVKVYKGDRVHVNSAIDNNASSNWAVWYNTPMCIKAVDGVDQGTPEATEVANAISAANAGLQLQYDNFVNEVRNMEFRNRYVLAETTSPTYATTIQPNTLLADSIANYDFIIILIRMHAPASGTSSNVGKLSPSVMTHVIDRNAISIAMNPAFKQSTGYTNLDNYIFIEISSFTAASITAVFSADGKTFIDLANGGSNLLVSGNTLNFTSTLPPRSQYSYSVLGIYGIGKRS